MPAADQDKRKHKLYKNVVTIAVAPWKGYVKPLIQVDQIPKRKYFSSRVAIVFAQSIESQVLSRRMKTWLAQRRQAILQPHLSDQ